MRGAMFDAVRSHWVCLGWAGRCACVWVRWKRSASLLRSRLLSVADLPAGWSSVAVSASPVKVTDTPCLAHLGEREGLELPDRRLRRGQVDPEPRRGARDRRASRAVWDRFDTALTSCRSAMLQLGNTKVEATVRPVGVPAARSHLVCVRLGVPAGWDGSGRPRPVPDRPVRRLSLLRQLGTAALRHGRGVRTGGGGEGTERRHRPGGRQRLDRLSSGAHCTHPPRHGRVPRDRDRPPLLLLTGYSGTIDSGLAVRRRPRPALPRHHARQRRHRQVRQPARAADDRRDGGPDVRVIDTLGWRRTCSAGRWAA